jgi:uncharacterized Zn finger protein
VRNPSLVDLWRAEIEGFPVGQERIRQGHNYFSRGAVSEFAGSRGQLEAKVQGSREEPYAVRIGIDLYPPTGWNRLLEWLDENDWDKSELEQGRVSMGLSLQLETLGMSLVPQRYKDMRSACDCPDWMQPCKHVLAVCFAFGLEMEHDPLVLLRLRGGHLLEKDPAAPVEQLTASREELRLDAESFWREAPGMEALSLEIGAFEETRLRRYWQRLGPLPFWGGSFDLGPMLKPIYEEVRTARLRGPQEATGPQRS